jgi:hypothetical protein
VDTIDAPTRVALPVSVNGEWVEARFTARGWHHTGLAGVVTWA